ncbi:MAG: carboxymuconolactone decarboxylase family protein [Nitriliruptorales bacterium]
MAEIEAQDRVEAEPLVPYGDRSTAPDKVRRQIEAYEERMGFLPNAIKLYVHVPHIMQELIRLNNATMRHADNLIPEDFKYRMSLVISRGHGCRYCCAHHAMTLKRKFGLDDARIEEILHLESPEDEREAVAWEYAYAASRGQMSHDEGDDIRVHLAEHFSPPEVMELAATVGFWACYNRIHSSLAIPIEEHLLGERHWVDVGRD